MACEGTCRDSPSAGTAGYTKTGVSGSIQALRETLIELQRSRDSHRTQRVVLECVLDGIRLDSSDVGPDERLAASFEILGRLVAFESAMLVVQAGDVRRVLATSGDPFDVDPNDDRLHQGPARAPRIHIDRPPGIASGPRSVLALPLPTNEVHCVLILGHAEPRRFHREQLPALRRYAPLLAEVVGRVTSPTPSPRRVVGADADDPVLRVASDGRLLLANRASAPLLDAWGVRPGDPAPDSIREVLPEHGCDQPLCELQVGDREYAVAVAPVASRGHVDVFAFDVTRQRVRQRELRASERRSRRLLHTSNHAFMVLDADGRLLDLNPACRGLLGIEPQGPPHVDACTREALQRVAQDTIEVGGCHLNLPVRRDDGQSFLAEFSASSNDAHDGVEILVLVRDASAQRRAETHLQTLSMVAEKTDTAVLIADAQGQIEWVNAAFATMTGHAAHEVVGRSHDDLLRRDETDPETIEEIQRGLASRQPFRVERLAHRPQGRPYWVAMSITPVRDATGDVTKHFALLTDITHQRQSEAALRRSKDSAEEASRLKSEFVATVSHELRTPLNAVLGMTDLVLQGELDRQQRGLLRVAQNNAEALLTIIDELLDLSRIESGKLELEPEPFCPRDLFESVCEALGANSEGPAVELVCDCDPRLPSQLLGDAARLRQVVTNLLGNALKFTSRGRVVLHADLVEQADGDPGLRLCVEDSGVGIPPDRLSTIFESFVQSDAATRRRFGGTGLGLAISRMLVERMGGRIWCESTVGEGSRFFVELTLPTLDNDAPTIAADPAIDGRQALVVDPCDASRRAIARLLSAWGFEVFSEPVPELFARRPAAGAWDLVVLDRRVASWIADDAHPATQQPTIVTTRLAELRIAEASELHAPMVTKPVRAAALRQAIDAAIGLAPDDDHHRPASRPRGEGATVLVVEDDDVDRELAERQLARHGYVATTVSGGEQALALLREHAFDVVITDLEMSPVDGIELIGRARHMERQQQRSPAPIVVLSAHAQASHRRRCLAAGATEVLSKPTPWLAVLERLATLRRAPLRVLLVDDSPDMRTLVRHYLEADGHYVVTEAAGGREAIELGERETFDVAIVDALMPDVDGLTVVSSFRHQRPQMAVLALTGLEPGPQLRAMVDAGAGVCLRKPVRREALMQALRGLEPCA